MSSLKVGKTSLEDGKVRICVPIAFEEEEQILAEAAAISACGDADIAEWRIDWYRDVFCPDRLSALFGKVRAALGEKPLLVTFRSKREGGNRAITPQAYQCLLEQILLQGGADLLDIELSAGEDCVRELIRRSHEAGVPVILSMHDFHKTPPADTLVSVMEQMLEAGADICKTAVMPSSRLDAAVLLTATAAMKEKHPQALLVTMSMGALGSVSRICGGCFGSVMSFGALGKASAPGQASAAALKQALSAIEACTAKSVGIMGAKAFDPNIIEI